MIAKINIDGEDRWVIVMPAKTSFVSLKDFKLLSIVVNSGISETVHKVPIPTVCAAVDLAAAVKELPPNINAAKEITQPLELAM